MKIIELERNLNVINLQQLKLEQIHSCDSQIVTPCYTHVFLSSHQGLDCWLYINYHNTMLVL